MISLVPRTWPSVMRKISPVLFSIALAAASKACRSSVPPLASMWRKCSLARATFSGVAGVNCGRNSLVSEPKSKRPKESSGFNFGRHLSRVLLAWASVLDRSGSMQGTPVRRRSRVRKTDRDERDGRARRLRAHLTWVRHSERSRFEGDCERRRGRWATWHRPRCRWASPFRRSCHRYGRLGLVSDSWAQA